MIQNLTHNCKAAFPVHAPPLRHIYYKSARFQSWFSMNNSADNNKHIQTNRTGDDGNSSAQVMQGLQTTVTVMTRDTH